ncbi:ATP-binding cassette sub-family C member 4-like [Condylostylus longicornis]|uniref:ATP-binding cassette sub-family C member 4-like n=1 Tax=Condylostylus longicornis TaxID=2530218 RepID=UPI00244DDEAA|nr:ATP-binding cassette sub-family C member 4-like [Condylostylus longicornis]XP_055378031.1 ATP-binding cassette sub-family C member 4-like [Condylostylus longicornis]XP_055378032.1 ATP-binding cassette sub-family C member 4-like [Condylostylus longicornis]XP_055378033.1 ATP-binding cassette sub-family C member 4-like [Condylostylus longicornis]XP_055378034.1 ATP-binding cassette sub-family C member 4-like [Condylostylus longicornis]
MESSVRTLPPNPKDKANIVSVLLFGWTINVFKTGYSKVLQVTDLFQPLQKDLSSSLGDRLEIQWAKQLETKKPSLIKAMFLTFWREVGVLAILTAFNELCIRLLQPILLGQLLLFFRLDPKDKENNNEAYYYGGGLVLSTAVSLLTFNHFTMNAFHMGMKFRVAVCSLIYRKSLKLSRTALGDTAPGKVVNLLSNDVSRFDIFAVFINSMWSAPLLSIIVGVLLWNEIRWAGIVGIVVIFFVVPIQSYAGKLSSKFRYQTAMRTDERVRFMDEIISGIQVIKMYAWEVPFSKLITLARKLELKIVRKNSHVRALYMTFNMFTTRAAMFCTMMTMALTDAEITAARIFVISSYFNVIAWTMSQMFVRGVAEIAEALVAFKRLQKFLEYEEKPPSMHKTENSSNLTNFKTGNGDINNAHKINRNSIQTKPYRNSLYDSMPAIVLKNASAHWELYENPSEKKSGKRKLSNGKKKQENLTLDNINLEIKRGQLIGIVGSVGAGKSSLLQIILEELPLLKGALEVNGKVSYATQEPWVFAATVRQNILFGQDMEKSRYDAVVKSCALVKDFEQFADGDRTVIGEKGASLSGGQKARISLARAVYREADIYLLDDPLSAVDAHVGKHLFDEVIGPRGRLGRRSLTRILVTHQVHFLKEADWVVILNNGKIQIQGPPQKLSKSGIDFAELLENDNETDANAEGQQSRRRSSSRSLGSSHHSLRSTESNSDEENEEERDDDKDENQNLEQSSKGTVKGSLIGNYLRAGAHFVIVGFVLCLFLITQAAVSLADFWVSFWTSQEELRDYLNQNQTMLKGSKVGNNDEVSKISIKQLQDHMDRISHLNEIRKDSLINTDTCIYIHGAIILSIFTIGIIRSETFYTLAVRASQKLHDAMFKGIVMAPMRFFDTNPSGRILNRFSKDMGAVDELLPKAMLDATQIILNMFGAIIVTLTVRPIFAVPLVLLGALFMLVRKIYLKTSKNIKRLEGVTRSPVFTHLAATLSGLSTIRAFGAQTELIQEFDNHQDLHSGSWYMFISTSTAFGLSLDLICLIFMTCVTFYFLLFDTDVMGSDVGLAITQSMSLAFLLQWGIRQSAEVANQMMAVERILEYRELEAEKQPDKIVEQRKTWPEHGKIEFRNVRYRYYDGADPVLNNLNFVIKPQEKIGIVGRTGAGKSSVIGALFRLAKIEGDIFIDDIKTDSVVLNKLRSKISIIPQDPVLFSGTLRRNLDPFEEYRDADLWSALESVELKDIASGNLGLQSAVMAGGSNYSVGQRQLVCLARAILRNNKILVLDEATANVDPHTDALIQETIRNKFSSCTVLTIAHRLHTIMDSDRILVMNFGKVSEFDTPYTLLQNPNGIFSDMVKATGPHESERLQELAKTKHLTEQKES